MMRMVQCVLIVMLLVCAAMAVVTEATIADPPIEVTTETKERIVLIRGLPYRIGKFCVTFAQAPDVTDPLSLLRQGGVEGVWAERAVSAQWYAKYENTWTCTFLRAQRISSANDGSNGEPPYDDNRSWTKAIFQGRLLTPVGLPVTRVGNIAEKPNINFNKQGSGSNVPMYISFDKEWYYYYNRIPWRIVLSETTDPSTNNFIVVYSCYSIFRTQFESVIAYTKERDSTFPFGGLFGLESALAGIGIELAINNQLQVTVQNAFCPTLPTPAVGPIVLEAPPPPGTPPSGSPPPYAPPPGAPPSGSPPPYAPPPGAASSPPPVRISLTSSSSLSTSSAHTHILTTTCMCTLSLQCPMSRTLPMQ